MGRTKIVCTLGPASSGEDTLRAMISAGMSVARINLSHGKHEEHARVMGLVRSLSDEMGRVVALMADLQGPKIRIGSIEREPMMLHEGRQVTLKLATSSDTDSIIPVPHREIISGIKVGGNVWLDDGLLKLKVEEKRNSEVRCRIIIGGPLVSSKGISAPGVRMEMDTITSKDRKDLKFAIEQGVDYLALSFVRSAADVIALRDLTEDFGAKDLPIVAKIERSEALDSIDAIIKECDAVMVARGDLGVEIPAEDVPSYQKSIIHACNKAGKPVITATQMLNSMILNSRPTRAEASDVYNAILDGTDAVMLSGETAVGQHPALAVETMALISRRAEMHFPYDAWNVESDDEETVSFPEAIGRATCSMAEALEAKAIITSTRSGYTARQVAKQRPRTPILCTTPSLETYRHMALVWGVEPLMADVFQHTDEMIKVTMHAVTEAGMVKEGDLVVITAGTPTARHSQTNLVKVHWVGEESRM